MRKFLCSDETTLRLSVDGWRIVARYRDVSIESWDRRDDGDVETREKRARARSWVAGCRATGTVLVPVGQTYGTVSTRTRCTMPDRLRVSLGVDGQVVCGHSELRRDTVDPALNLSNRSLRSTPHRTIVVSSSPLKKSLARPLACPLLLPRMERIGWKGLN